MSPGHEVEKIVQHTLQSRINAVGSDMPARPRSKTEEMTDIIDDIAIEHGEPLAAMALQVLSDGMKSRDFKQRIEAAKAFLHNFHNPAKRIDMDVQEQVTITAAAREATDGMTDEERQLMDKFQAKLLELRPDVIEVEAHDVTEEHDEPEKGGWDAPSLPPLPPEGREA